MKRYLLALTLGLFLILVSGMAGAYQAMQGPTETLLWDKTRAFNGYTLFAAHGTTYLIDMQGQMVHSWKLGTNPKLLDNGHILDASKDDPSRFSGFMEVDWDGNVVWQYTETRTDYSPHHDFIRVFNKKLNAYTTMFIANRSITNAQALAVGADPANAPYTGAQVDAIVEVDMNGKVVWEWWFLDHLIQSTVPSGANYTGSGKTIADYPGRLDVNMPGRPLRSDWLHCNSLDYNEDLDQVVINAVQGEFYVIDHGGTFVKDDPAASIALAAGSAGDFLYRFGDPARYKQGDPPSIPLNWTTAVAGHKQIGGAHDIHWIRPGLPGAGHFLIYNNGQYLFELTNQSYAQEIAPYLDSTGTDTGHYVNPPSAGYTVYEAPKDTAKPKRNISKQIAWSFGSQSPSGMASHIGGSVQRLPNGNTLICNDTEGHLIEVTAGGTGSAAEVVWEYISPVTKAGALKIMKDAVPMTNSLFRAYRFAADHPAFVGRDLSPHGLITDLGGQTVTDGDSETIEMVESEAEFSDVEQVSDGDAAERESFDTDTETAADVEPTTDGDCPATPCNCPASGKSGCQSTGSAGATGLLFITLFVFVTYRRRSSALLVLLAVVLIGCSGSGGSSDPATDGDSEDADTVVADGDSPDGDTLDADTSEKETLEELDGDSNDSETSEIDAVETETDGETTVCDVAYPDRTVGLRLCRPLAEKGYILYPVKHRGDVYLIDRLGRVVNHWSKSLLEPGQSCYLRPNGNLVRAAMIKGTSIGGGEGGRIEEYDWDDNLVWAFDFATDAGTTHHDFKILPNGNLLMLAVERKDKTVAVAAGFDAAQLRDGYVAPEMLVEIEKTGATTYKVVWEWHVWDHLLQYKNPSLANYLKPSENPGRLEVTGSAPAFWNHANSVHYNPELDQIVISARSHNELWVIDHSTTSAEAATRSGGRYGKGGDFLYRWGNPATYGAGTAADRMLFNQHDAQWIEPGLPGAGNFLIFNNGLDRPGGNYSTIDEFTPPVLADGSYPALATGIAWGPKTLAWQYKATPPTTFYGSEISGTQRLPNGNTLNCEGTTARFFEVTSAGEIVWEYVNPVANDGPMAQYELASLDPKGHPENAVFKIHWYPADFAGFVGRDLTPGSVIETSDATCPIANNPSYTCKALNTCTTDGGVDVSSHFSCASGGICCFKLIQDQQPPQP